MKKKSLMILFSVMVFFIVIVGGTYAFFNYTRTGGENTIVMGQIYMHYNTIDTISLQNAEPRSELDPNTYVSFTIDGKNTNRDKDIWYEIELVRGEYTGTRTTRIRDDLLRFTLTEQLGNNGDVVNVVDNVSFEDLINRKIWINTIPKNTTSELVYNYKLYMWIDNSINVGNTNNADYSVAEWNDLFASVGVKVIGDLNEKSLPSSSITSDSYVENGKSYFINKLSNSYLMQDQGELLDTNDVVKLEITNPDNLLYFQYRDSKGNEDLTNNNESLTLTYTYNKNETIDIQVFTISRNDANVSTDLKFKVTKNGTVVEEYLKHVNVIGNNYCLNNGFNKLSDCILVTENLSSNINDAKAYISSKGAPDVNKTAPTYQYVEEQTENVTYTGTSGYPNWSSGAKYTFDATTGKFTLKQADGATNATNYVALSSDLIDKYTCGTSNIGYGTCGTIYKVTSVDTNNNKITGTKITHQVSGSLDSQVGLYKVLDNDGDSYIYRGNVTNNNVLFGGYYWKIVRINGDGSIRLIFNGKTLSADGNKTADYASSISTTTSTGAGSTYPFNSNPGGPTYVGYMNTESENYWTTDTLTTYTNFAENTAYYFSDDFETYTDAYGNRQFKLKGNTYQSKVKDLTASQIEAHPYTCNGTNANLICNRLVKVNSRASNTSVTGYYITYSPNYDSNTSLTKADVEKNENDSTAKKQLELWYHDKFMNNQNNGKTVTMYLVDNPFCNDRSILNTYTNGSYTLNNSYNSGYLLTNHTYYAGRTRLIEASQGNKSATLVCANANDLFGVESGNAKLTYPVGLITADEFALAGGKYNEENSNFYLRTNGYFWTMTPSYFLSAYALADEFVVYPSGLLNIYYVTLSIGLRAVINLSPSTLITQGDGTVDHPYELTIE